MAQEKNFENKVKNHLEKEGCWYVKYFANGFTKSGIPDILCCCEGHFVAIEVKASNGKPTEVQIDKLKEIDKAGGYSVLLYPKDFENFKDLILCLKKHELGLAQDVYEHTLKGRWLKWDEVFTFKNRNL